MPRLNNKWTIIVIVSCIVLAGIGWLAAVGELHEIEAAVSRAYHNGMKYIEGDHH
jgi:hypothetical protein